MRRSSASYRAAPPGTHLQALTPVWRVLHPWVRPNQSPVPSPAVTSTSIVLSEGTAPQTGLPGLRQPGLFLANGPPSPCPPPSWPTSNPLSSVSGEGREVRLGLGRLELPHALPLGYLSVMGRVPAQFWKHWSWGGGGSAFPSALIAASLRMKEGSLRQELRQCPGRPGHCSLSKGLGPRASQG